MRRQNKIRLVISGTILVLLGCILVAIYSNAIRIYIVVSGSMEPSLQIGDRIIIDTKGFPERYDIIAFEDPTEPGGNPLVKRIIGLGGDEIKIEGGILYINGKEQYNRHVMSNQLNWVDSFTRVPKGYVFVLGDNRNESFDSLNFGPIPEHKIIGLLSFIVWPPGRWGRLEAFEDPKDANANTPPARS